jgi:class 3 adenylate cyclase
LLQFLYGCFTDPRYGQFLQLAKGDAARRHAIRLFVVGAAQACITSLPKPVRPKLTEMIDEALAVPGGDLRERQEFIDDLQKHCLAEKSAPLLREGREAMTNYLGNGRIDIQWLPSTLEAWVKPDPVEMPPPAEPEEHKPQPVAIMFTDIVPPVTTGSDFDAEMAKLAEQHDFTVGMAVKMHFGHQVQQSGSGMMAVFPRICDAVAAAAAIQREITDRNELGFGPGLPLRIGIAAGNSDPKDTGQFASVVETAARLCATASAGQAVLPAWLADMTGCEGFVFSDPFAPAAKVLPDQQRARLLIGTPAPAPVMADAKDIPEHSSSPMPVLERSASPAPAAE